MLNTAWLVQGSQLSEDDAHAAGLELDRTIDGFSIYRNQRVLPRFFLVSNVRRSTDEGETFRMLADAGFDPARSAIAEGLPGDLAGLATGPVTVQSYGPNSMRLSTDTAGPAFLATSEVMYSGWEATVNGTHQPLFMTNGAFRGLMLPAGHSDIVLAYHPPHLGLYLSISGVLALLAIAVVVWNPQPRET
jgi:hypothetical protein